MAFDPNPAVQAESAFVLVPVLGATVTIAGLVLFAPLARVRRAIRASRLEALAQVAVELRALRRTANPVAGREADLLARRAWLERLDDWPLHVSMLQRFGLYVFVPVVSWFFGTLARRLLDTVLMDRLLGHLLQLVY